MSGTVYLLMVILTPLAVMHVQSDS